MRRLACLMLLAFCIPSYAQEMEPGEWEFTTTMSSPGMPKPHTMTNKRCVTKGDTDPSRWSDKKEKSDCKVLASKKAAGTQSWEVTCPQSGMKGSGTARVTGNTIESEMRMAGASQGQKFEMHTKTTGKRLGACKQK